MPTAEVTAADPVRVLRGVAGSADGGPATRAVHAVWGHGSGDALDCVEGLWPRSAAVKDAAARAAHRALAMRPARISEATTELGAETALDAWLARALQVAAGATAAPPGLRERLEPLRLSPTVQPASAGSDFGALMERIRRDFGWSFPLTEAARTACGCADRVGPQPGRSGKRAVPPAATLKWLREQRPAVGDVLTATRVAAIAVASATGMPISLTASLRTKECRTVLDKESGRAALVLGIEERLSGRKVHARRAVGGTRPTTWTASAAVHIGEFFAAWLARRVADGHDHVFPRVRTVEGRQFLDDTAHISNYILEAAIKSVDPAATWHGMRLGFERAVDLVHEVGGGPPQPVAPDVKNTLTLRSNRALRGSRDVYILDRLRPLVEATRAIHLVAVGEVGGLLVGGGAGDGAEELRVVPPFATSCAQCGDDLPEEEGGCVCDVESCDWTLCLTCFPDPTAPLLCPGHEHGDPSET